MILRCTFKIIVNRLQKVSMLYHNLHMHITAPDFCVVIASKFHYFNDVMSQYEILWVPNIGYKRDKMNFLLYTSDMPSKVFVSL